VEKWWIDLLNIGIYQSQILALRRHDKRVTVQPSRDPAQQVPILV